MRRTERQITDLAEMERVLRGATVVHLAMVDEGRPYVVPLNFGYADGCLYLHGASEGRKMAVLARNPRVSFCLYTDNELVRGTKGCDWSARYRSVIGEGHVEILEGDDARRRGLDIILKQYATGTYEYRPETLERTCVFRVVIDSMTGKKANV